MTATGRAPRRVLFALIGKLGDTVASYAAVRSYADAFSGDAVTLLVRARYAPLFAREAGVRVIGFSSRFGLYARLAGLRWFEPPFDALLVLLGSGPPIRGLGRILPAGRKIFLDGRFRDLYPEWPQIPPEHLHSEPAWRVVQLLEPNLAQPRCSSIPSLAARRRPAPAVAIAPVSDEPRRSMAPATLGLLVAALARRHPGCEIRILVNPADRDAGPLLAAGAPAGARFERFRSVPALLDSLCGIAHLYATDTGLYHLAAAIGVPTTTYFGPTQPWKNSFPAQPALVRVRLAALGGDHCEEKRCREPACLAKAVALDAGEQGPARLEATPVGCPLRRHPAAALEHLAVQSGPAPAVGREPVPVH